MSVRRKMGFVSNFARDFSGLWHFWIAGFATTSELVGYKFKVRMFNEDNDHEINHEGCPLDIDKSVDDVMRLWLGLVIPEESLRRVRSKEIICMDIDIWKSWNVNLYRQQQQQQQSIKAIIIFACFLLHSRQFQKMSLEQEVWLVPHAKLERQYSF